MDYSLGIVVRGEDLIASDPFLELLQRGGASILVRIEDDAHLPGIGDAVDCGIVVLFILCPLGQTLVAHLPDVLRGCLRATGIRRGSCFRLYIARLLPLVRLGLYQVLRQFNHLLEIIFQFGQFLVLGICEEGDFHLENKWTYSRPGANDDGRN